MEISSVFISLLLSVSNRAFRTPYINELECERSDDDDDDEDDDDDDGGDGDGGILCTGS